MTDAYVNFAPFISSWRAIRSDVVLRITLLRSGALLPGDAEALCEFLDRMDAIVDGLRRGVVVPLTQVYRCCHRVKRAPGRDELLENISLLAATYRHTLFITRPIPVDR